jgi:hypothetical protein
MTTALGRFGHHPDPAIDFCVEVEILQGQTYEAQVGMIPAAPVVERIDRAMSFRVGGDLNAISAKETLRQCERAALKALALAEGGE